MESDGTLMDEEAESVVAVAACHAGGGEERGFAGFVDGIVSAVAGEKAIGRYDRRVFHG